MKVLIILLFSLLLFGCKKELSTEPVTASNEFQSDVNYIESLYDANSVMNKDVSVNIYFPDSIVIIFTANNNLQGAVYMAQLKTPYVSSGPVGYGDKNYADSVDYVKIKLHTSNYDYYYGASYEVTEGNYISGQPIFITRHLFKFYIYR